MKEILIRGGRRLEGEVAVDGAKNAALPTFTASLLTDEEVILKGIPSLKDIDTIVQMLEELGKIVEKEDENIYRIRQSEESNPAAPYELVRQMRASFLVLGPLLVRLGAARVPLPGGCVIGSRPVDLHLKGLSSLGAQIALSQGIVEAKASHLHAAEVYLDYPSVGATEHIMITAALIPGKTTINNPAQEPEVHDLAQLLSEMGAEIKTAPSKIEIEGAGRLHGATHTVIPDRVNAGTYMIGAAISGGEVLIRCNPFHLKSLLGKLEEMGAEVAEKDRGALVRGNDKLRATEVETRPYPGFSTDLQPQMMALLSIACGESTIKETIFERRFSHAAELCRMGADIKISGSSAQIRGVDNLEGAEVLATDIRAGAALVLAGLAARGTTIVRDAGHIERGYSSLVGDLKMLGAEIEEGATYSAAYER